MNWKPVLAQFVPPIVMQQVTARRGGANVGSTHELAPDGWPADEPETSWNDPAVAEHYRAAWHAFLPTVEGPFPIGYPSANGCPQWSDYGAQLKYVTYGYVLALAARNRQSVSVLDWGGNLGQYGVVGQRLLPDVRLDYHCKEVPLLCDEGEQVCSWAQFHRADQEFAGQQFDMVMASGSLQYVRPWRDVLSTLASATGGWLYVTRLPITTAAQSMVARQRVRFAGRQHTSYCWCFSRDEFLAATQQLGLKLFQEFLVHESMQVAGATESSQMRGFLFRRRGNVSEA